MRSSAPDLIGDVDGGGGGVLRPGNSHFHSQEIGVILLRSSAGAELSRTSAFTRWKGQLLWILKSRSSCRMSLQQEQGRKISWWESSPQVQINLRPRPSPRVSALFLKNRPPSRPLLWLGFFSSPQSPSSISPKWSFSLWLWR